MNDPGLDETIQNTADTVKNRLRSQLEEHPSHSKGSNEPVHGVRAAFLQELQDDDQEEEVGFYQPKIWWFTSTAFPLIAGTFGPMANLFSVCALVQTWRVKIPDGGTEAHGERISDPTWLIAVNSISLALALVANLFLLFNFAHRVTYAVAQPVTIGLWYISAILLLVPLGLTHTLIVDPTYTHAFSQSYYYGLIATATYLIIATLLVINVVGAYQFKAYPPSFNSLTIPQRTLMLQTMSYVFYLAAGAGVFSAVERWDYVDGVYWADYTLLTIGLGTDFPLQTNIGKGLLIPFSVGGIMMLGLVIGSVRGLVLERGQLKVKKRTLHKERQRWGRNAGDVKERAKTHKWTREEFEGMRAIENRADAIRKYSSLTISLLAFLIVWFMGALVFWFSEAPQGWTYFNSLYFSYTSLLTIGYGDFYPQSNSGKPFFVIWSLIAIPTVTILISNMGDTVVGWLTEGTLWLGQRTILPEKVGKGKFRSLSSMKNAMKKEKQREDKDADEDGEDGLRNDVEKLGGAVENAESEAGRPNALPARIAKEIRQLAADVGENPPKRYEWQQWKGWLELLGENEDDTTWLTDDGPLFSTASETEWVMAKLCDKLEEVLSKELKKT